jgi:lipoyl-dependent peroxiredoxin
MPIREATAIWQGSLREGNGKIRIKDRNFEQPYSFSSRFESGAGTNPEELIGAAHAGCFSMALAGKLVEAGYSPDQISTKAKVHLDKVGNGFKISSIELETEANVTDIDQEEFLRLVEDAKQNCPVSVALKNSVAINVKAKLTESYLS